MPTFKGKDGSDHFSMNPQVGKARFGSPKASGHFKEHMEHNAEHRDGDHESHGHVTLHDHGDGTYHSEHHDGEQVEHPHLHHAIMHMAHHHAPSGTHMHIHHEHGAFTSHHVDENGEHQGPHDHENIEALKDHMDQFLTEEGHEGQHPSESESGMESEPEEMGY